MKTLTSWSRLLPVLSLFVLPVAVSAQAAPTAPVAIGQRVEVSGGAYWNVSVAELKTMLEKKDFPLINTHVPFQGDLPQTDLSIPFDQITAQLDKLPADKNAPIVLYCRSGNMSTQASAELAAKGYMRVYNLTGGFNAWRAAGLPMKP